ncbi:protein-disulfide reductase DsbD family protein [Marinimicrobium alkaliphilum]|uniref:protein-disulfide reductase DsbD family protein n=1 Tax=Marinimicrobium alkaliphilum TaxID=2202654 RepID=UPI000DBA29F5|nr:protein-disulfide reductase DsbD [Marinimicrobium alkaliphilum]
MALALFASALASAQDPFGGSRSGGTDILGNSDDFLPVEEAFQLEAAVHNDRLVLHWDVAPEYYLYEERFRLAPVDAELPGHSFSRAGRVVFDEYFERDMEVFYGTATLYVDLDTATSPFALEVVSQGCADAGLCYPPHSDYLWVDPQTGEVTRLERAQFFDYRDGSEQPADGAESIASSAWLGYALLFALLGGVILNLMPCVFPVLSIKVLSLAQADRARLPLHGWAYTAGVVASFVAIAVALLVARAGGEAVGWGFQLQSPLLIAGLAYLFFVLGLSLSGLLHLGTRLMGAGQSLTQRSGLSGSFFTGVLASVVASPCTAPFMGAALGFALTQPALVSLSVFAALGLGMALPLLALCYAPGLARKLPQPGPWMDTLKQLLAFPLYLSAAWLLWVLGRQAGSDAIVAAIVGMILIAFACWLSHRHTRTHRGLMIRRGFAVIAWLLALALPWHWLNSQNETNRWQAYTPERLQQLRAEGRPVFINLTADWCLTCLANERMVLSTGDVEAAFDEHGVVTLKGDWTNTNPQITALLENYGRSGVPLYLWYPAGREGAADILPQVLTRNRVINTINGTLTP